ncbi:MAG: FG-GAP repeat domain-containing protein [Bryobacteraceae bacterium]
MRIVNFARCVRLAWAMAVLTWAATAATPGVSFNAQRVYPAGPKPDSVAIGDFNNDGKPDLAVALNDSGEVAVLLGNGDGTFQPPVTFAVGSSPDAVAVGDFNLDGEPDLAVANASSNTVSILLGKGDGTFQPQVSYPVETGPRFVVVADFNGDGKPDLAVANGGTTGTRPVFGHTISILLGKGDGTFQPQTNYDVAEQPVALAVGDFNGDGKADLAAACQHAGAVSILLGKGDGSFQPVVSYGAAGYPVSIAAGDFNGDGHADLAVADAESRQNDFAFAVLLGTGNGLFQPAAGYLLEGGNDYGTAIAVADFNGDGKADLAVAAINSRTDVAPCSISILFGNGDGTFQAPVSYEQNGKLSYLAAGDLNGDGTPDLVTINPEDGVELLLDTRQGTLRATTMDTLPGSPNSVAAGDFNGDGIPDLVVNGHGAVILLGNGDGTFQPPLSYGGGNGAIAVGDFNGDGIPDVASADYGDGLTNPGNTVYIILGNGDGTFQPPVGYTVDLAPTAIAVGDFNGDGKLDLAVTEQIYSCACYAGRVSILLGNGDGTFQPQTIYGTGIDPLSVAAGDFNGDGKLDLAITNLGESQGNVSILLGRGDGTFEEQTTYPAGANPSSVTAGDFNKDGKLDLAVANASSHNVSILLGDGKGTFQPPVNYEIGSGGSSVLATDFNGDGNVDLAVTNEGSSTISILIGNGNGTFQPQVIYATGIAPAAVASADFTGNGKRGLVTANSKSSNISILTNTTR